MTDFGALTLDGEKASTDGVEVDKTKATAMNSACTDRIVNAVFYQSIELILCFAAILSYNVVEKGV